MDADEGGDASEDATDAHGAPNAPADATDTEDTEGGAQGYAHGVPQEVGGAFAEVDAAADVQHSDDADDTWDHHSTASEEDVMATSPTPSESRSAVSPEDDAHGLPEHTHTGNRSAHDAQASSRHTRTHSGNRSAHEAQASSRHTRTRNTTDAATSRSVDADAEASANAEVAPVPRHRSTTRAPATATGQRQAARSGASHGTHPHSTAARAHTPLHTHTRAHTQANEPAQARTHTRLDGRPQDREDLKLWEQYSGTTTIVIYNRSHSFGCSANEMGACVVLRRILACVCHTPCIVSWFQATFDRHFHSTDVGVITAMQARAATQKRFLIDMDALWRCWSFRGT